MAEIYAHLYCETMIRNLLLGIDELEVMPYGRYGAFSDVVSTEEGVNASKV